MTIKVRTGDLDDGRGVLNIEIDGKEVLSFFDGEPEDNNLGRNFSDAYSIAGLLKRAFDAGLSGEKLRIIEAEYSEPYEDDEREVDDDTGDNDLDRYKDSRR